MTTTPKSAGLALLREPFPPNQISKLPKPKSKDAPKGKCPECGGWHGLPAVHLDYVGHAALTARLLDADPSWWWEPVGFDDKGLPALDASGGLWIKLTVCGVTRFGYGDAQGKTGPDAMKERIGDALRNAAMRFGAALDLWHKGDLYAHEHDEGDDAGKPRDLSKAGSVRHAVRDGIGDNLPEDWKVYLTDLATECTEMVKTGNAPAAAQRIAKDKLDDEQGTFLANKMDSKTRDAIKKAQAEIRAAFSQKAAA
jgi:hypothetical protein